MIGIGPRELASELSRKFGFNRWPAVYEVDAATYGYVCQALLDWALEHQFPDLTEKFGLKLEVGPNNGIMFKGVELLIRKDEK